VEESRREGRKKRDINTLTDRMTVLRSVGEAVSYSGKANIWRNFCVSSNLAIRMTGRQLFAFDWHPPPKQPHSVHWAKSLRKVHTWLGNRTAVDNSQSLGPVFS